MNEKIILDDSLQALDDMILELIEAVKLNNNIETDEKQDNEIAS